MPRSKDRGASGAVRAGAWIAMGLLAGAQLAACGWDPRRPFDRNAPPVEQALALYDAGEAAAAAAVLESYLSTGPCGDGNIGTPDLLRRRPDGTIDLGLSLFSVAESFGRRFGEEEMDAGWAPQDRSERGSRVACGLRIARTVGEDPSQSIETRARARYLEGNLDFLNGEYRDAVEAYGRALVLAPGRAAPPDGSARADDPMDALGRDAAYNRAIAMRRLRDREQDASTDAPSDGSSGDGGGDRGRDGGADGGGGPDGGGGDSGQDASPEQPDAGPPPPPPRADQDERMLDQLERAPAVQQEAARRMGGVRVRGMVDK